MKSSIQKLLLLAIKLCFIVAAFYLVFSKIDLNSVLKLIKECDPLYLLMAVLLSYLSLYFSALRSRYYFSTYDKPLTRYFAIKLYAMGYLFNTLLPGGIGGDGYKVYIMWKKYAFPKLKGLAVMLYERVNGFYALCLLGLTIYPFTSFFGLAWYLDLLVFISIIFITPIYLLGCIYILKDQVKTAIIASTYSFVVQILQIISACFTIVALNFDVNSLEITNYLLLFIVASIMAIIPVSIGGAGLRELTFLYGLALLGLPLHDQEKGVAFGMLCFIIYLLTALYGLLFIADKEVGLLKSKK